MKIKNLITIPANGKKDNSFVGIKIRNNKIEFHYPETYVLSNDDELLRNDILAILRTISLSGTLSEDKSSYNTDFNGDFVFPIKSYLWIINDYLLHGRYENKEKVFEVNTKGKINWKRTIKSNPIINNGNVIYTDIVYERKNQKDNILTEIYNVCVKVSIDNIGWLYNLTFDTNGINYDQLLNIRKKTYISTLKTEISHTFEDTKKIRLQNMLNVIMGLDENMSDTNDIVYGVDSYENVYERMIDNMFSNIKNIKEFYPSATWDLIKEKKPKNSSNLRPDTILIKDNKVYILDAKYYRYGTTFSISDIPETTSIQKQITYGEYIKKVKIGIYDDVFSAFVMPYSKIKNIYNDELKNNMEFVGIATAKWYDSTNTNSRRIAGILIDTNYLINNWINKDEDNLNSIIKLIEDNVIGYIR